ncbi:hypothetical protein B0T16DRAFT_391928 [Cercophora newfieldiana]|uniref:Transmembrane protein n=1 Tax=Cercophora newfieldiana TaxID=92897 RepID=A0AA39Y1J1_9PEZI|nr:hypothetical protein B0T16DRAFT_391928 [Cercophora newfieldiana]
MTEPTTIPLQIPEAAAMASPTSAPTPHSPLRSQTNRPHLPRRQSRFTEDMTGEHTPVPSVYETSSPVDREPAPSLTSVSARSRGRPGAPPSTYTYTPSTAPSREYRPVELIARGMNGCLHAAACVILIALMVEFLAQVEGSWPEQIGAQAVTLLIFLAMDTLLDIVSLLRLQKEWASWALLLRLVSGIAYIILFMAYIAHGSVFPQGYSFWAMSPTFAGPVVYIFLWLLGLWNLCHVALRRHRLGNGLRACVGTTSPSSTQPLSPGAAANPRWRRWIGTSDRYSRTGDHDLETQPHFQPRVTMSSTTVAPSPPISLRDRPTCTEVKRPSYTATTRTASSHSYAKAEEKGVALKEEDESRGEKAEEKI